MSEEPKSAGGLIVKEIADVVPETDKKVGGRALGEAFVNVGDFARDLTAILAAVVAVPRRTRDFTLRLVQRWRKIPRERRQTPPADLLLTAAAGYASTADEDLRECFERLAASAMDRETARWVHPSFSSSLAQMSALEARFMKQIRAGGSFDTYTDLGRALGVVIDATSLALAVENLARLGFVEPRDPVKVSPFTEVDLYEPNLPQGGWSLHLYFETDPEFPTRNLQQQVPVRVRLSYYLTRLGTLFVKAVSDDDAG